MQNKHFQIIQQVFHSIIYAMTELFLALLRGLTAFLVANGMSVVLPAGELGFRRMQPMSWIWIAVFAAVWFVLHKVSKIRTGRAEAFVFALFCTLTTAVGYYFKTWNGFRRVCAGAGSFFNYGCHFLAVFIVSGCAALLFFACASGFVPSCRSLPRRRKTLLFAAFFVLLLVCRLPWFLYQYPGNLSPDSLNQISQAVGKTALSNNHPVLHTLWIRLLITLGGSEQAGIVLYSITQQLLTAAVFSLCTLFIYTRTGSVKAAGFTLLYFAFYPVHSVYGMTMWKDIPFSICLLLITMILFRAGREGMASADIRVAAGLFLLLCLLRHNGILIFVPVWIVLLRRCPDRRRVILSAGLTALGCFALIELVLIPACGVKAGRASEGFSIPLQQIARTVRDHLDEIPAEQLDAVRYYFGGKNVWEIYRSHISDPVKSSFAEDRFSAEPLPFVRLWLNLAVKYPRDYLEAVIAGCYGYYAPEAKYTVFFHGGSGLIKLLGMDSLDTFLTELRYHSVPVLSWIFNPGACCWLCLLALLRARLRKHSLLPHLPVLILWVMMIGSPVFCEFRYVYAAYCCLPLLLCDELM